MDWKELLTNNKFRWLLLTLLVVAPFEVLSLFSIHLPLWVEFPLFLAITIFFGKGVFQSGFRSLLKLDFSNINLLMTIAVLGAIYLRQFEEAVIIVVLFALGETSLQILIRFRSFEFYAGHVGSFYIRPS